MESRESSQSLSMSINSEEAIADISETSESPKRYFEEKDGLRSIEEIPPKYRHIFQYPYFNRIQSQVMDDVLYSDKSIVVSAPTGSGKTAIFELAIVRLLLKMKELKYNNDFKIIYMAPMKALCTERLMDWHGKFTKLGISSIEVTGDSNTLDFNQLKSYRIIMTTPEKWDSLTRRWKDNRQMVDLVKLFIIDEVHLLNEEVRGPVLEAVISRMKTIQESIDISSYMGNKTLEIGKEASIKIRFVAASATIPNVEDIGEWLSIKDNAAICHKIGDEYRPVKLTKVVEGYSSRDDRSLFKFDLFLNYKLRPIIEKYCDGKPTLIFCNTRKSVMLTAETLSKELMFHFTTSQTSKFRQMASTLSEKKLQSLVLSGIGCHHAGLLHNDRNIIEQMFKQGDLPILITTSTLAMGVNLPAHLVIIKTTQHYVNGAYTEYDESSILQMIGRAGRPQFDNRGVAVIMTKVQDKERYEKLCGGQRAVESKLHKHLVEHLNAEIALGTLPDLLLAMDWLRSTFLYVRATKNPTHYGCNRLAGRESIEKKLQEICVKWINALARAGLLIMDADTRVKSTEAGVLMASHCLDFDTMKLILKIKGNESLNDLLKLVSECHEFEDIVLRASEKRCLNQLNKNARNPSNRFPLPGKIQTKHMKANCIIQAVFGNLPIFDPSLTQESIRIMRTGENVIKCIVAYVTRPTAINSSTPIYKSLLNAIILTKCFAAKMWENSVYVSRQLTGIGPAFATLLVSCGKTSFDLIRQSNPRDLERILNKGPPAGNNIIKQVMLLPLYVINLELEQNRMLHVSLSIDNHDKFKDNTSTTGMIHKVSLIVGDSENNLLLYTVIQDKHLFNMPNATIHRKLHLKISSAHTVFAHCISNNWVGIDVIASINIKESHSKIIPSSLQSDIRNFISKSFTYNEDCKSSSMDNGFNDELYDYLFDDVIEESQNDKKSKKRTNEKVVPKNKKSKKIKKITQESDTDATLIGDLNFLCGTLENNKGTETPNRAKKIQKTISSIWKNKKNVFENNNDDQIIEEFSQSEFMSSFNMDSIELKTDTDTVNIQNIDYVNEDNLNDIISQEINKLEQLNKNSNDVDDLNNINSQEKLNKDSVANQSHINEFDLYESNIDSNANLSQYNEDINLNDMISKEINKLEQSSLFENKSQYVYESNFNVDMNKLEQSFTNQSQQFIDSEEIYELEQSNVNSIVNQSHESQCFIEVATFSQLKFADDNQNTEVSKTLCSINDNDADCIEKMQGNANRSIKWIDPLIVGENKKTCNLNDNLETSLEVQRDANSKTDKERQFDDDLLNNMDFDCNEKIQGDANRSIKWIDPLIVGENKITCNMNNNFETSLEVQRDINSKTDEASQFNDDLLNNMNFDQTIQSITEEPVDKNSKISELSKETVVESSVSTIQKNLQPKSLKSDIEITLLKHSQIYKNELNISQIRVDDFDANEEWESSSTIDLVINKTFKKRPSICNIFTYNNENEISKYYLDENVQECNDHIKDDIISNASSPEEIILLDKELEENILDPQWVIMNAYKKYQNSASSFVPKYKSKLKKFDNTREQFNNDTIISNGSQYSIFSDRYSQMTQSMKIESPPSSQALTIDIIRQFANTPKNKLKPLKRMRYS